MISKKSELYTVEFNKSCIFKKALVVIQSQSVFQLHYKKYKIYGNDISVPIIFLGLSFIPLCNSNYTWSRVMLEIYLLHVPISQFILRLFLFIFEAFVD